MSGYSSTPKVIALILAGVALSFVVFELNPVPDAAPSASWSLADAEPVSVHDPGAVRRFLGIEESEAQSEAAPAPVPDNPFGHSFVIDGKEYRLSGLILDGEDASATLVEQSGNSTNLRRGEVMPVGRKIVSISINQIVTENPEGRTERVPIYPTMSERQ